MLFFILKYFELIILFMNLSNIQLYNSFKSKKVVKVITGIHNTNIYQIAQMAQAANLANATYLDVSANAQIVKFLKSFSSLPLCISSIDPIDIYNCVLAGADLVEVGNYDIFYSRGIYINSVQLIKLVKEIKYLVGNIDICVTIPYHLNLNEQIKLAQDLKNLGVNILQTEGVFFYNVSKSLSKLTNSLSSSLISTYFLSKHVDIPVITASGITSLFASMPIKYGASGIGIGSAIKYSNNVIDMVNIINEVKSSMYINSFKNYLDINKTKIYINNNNRVSI
uniref:hypothetical protein Ycf23 n=1 Tax=Lophurella stichidiosa TaxID=2008659 RepID=UPI00255202F3|nr:hypothetical protein Ycf23 [Aphanocladia stichidiosa]WGH13943.1 hypothetical protein Ycf23 [Aphanocladia stichidiosa]